MKNFSAKNALYDLFAIAPHLNKVLKERPEFEPLIKFIHSKDFYNDEDIPYPSLKEVEKELNVKTHTVRKLIKDLHEYIINYEEPRLNFHRKRITFYLKYLDRRFQFSVDDLPVMPRIGETFEIPFVKARLNTYLFYMDDIYHVMESDMHHVRIYLKTGKFNTYLKYRRDKANTLRELDFKDWFITDWAFERKILEGELEP